jgi:hypothetical protein
MRLNSLFRAADLGATNQEQLYIGPSSWTSLGVRLLQWKLPGFMRVILGNGIIAKSF